MAQEGDKDTGDSADHSASQQISESQYYTHRDYAHTFHSKKEGQHFLDTGEVKGKGLLQKVQGIQPKEPCYCLQTMILLQQVYF